MRYPHRQEVQGNAEAIADRGHKDFIIFGFKGRDKGRHSDDLVIGWKKLEALKEQSISKAWLHFFDMYKAVNPPLSKIMLNVVIIDFMQNGRI